MGCVAGYVSWCVTVRVTGCVMGASWVWHGVCNGMRHRVRHRVFHGERLRFHHGVRYEVGHGVSRGVSQIENSCPFNSIQVSVIVAHTVWSYGSVI